MSAHEYMVAETEGGQVIGVKKETCFKEEYFSFQGIPYAKPPVGKLRFKDPQPAYKWSNILDATKETLPCYNLDLIQGKICGSEDSLHINVFTKHLQPDTPYPVMVYIYGGAFKTGSSTMNLYSPDFLFMHDVIFVSFNYRLGALGFLSLNNPTLEVPGNAGLKDQNLALKWVKNNIHRFGGDPNNITLFGESAGACSVNHHMISEKSKGLFHKAIPMSGSSLCNWSVIPRLQWAERLAKNLGWNGEGEASILEFLQNVDPVKIVEAQDRIVTPQESSEYILFPFGPIVEPYVTGNTFIPEEPLLLSRKAWSKGMDILIGATSEEGLFYYKFIQLVPALLKALGDLEKVVPAEFNLDRKEAKCNELGVKLKKYYYGDKDISVEEPLYTLMTDKLFLHGIYRTILSRQKLDGHGKTYFYRFNMDSPTQNHYKIRNCGPNVRGVCHADDLSYVFKNNFPQQLEQNSDELKVTKVMTSLFASFAISGDPNNSEIKHLKWEAVEDINKIKCLNISNVTTFIDHPEAERMNLWNSLYEAMKSPLI